MSDDKPPKKIARYNAVAKLLYRAKEPIMVQEIATRLGCTKEQVKAAMQDAKRLCIRHGAPITNLLGSKKRAEPEVEEDEIGAAVEMKARGYKRANSEEYEGECNKSAQRAVAHILAQIENLYLWQQSGKAPDDFDFKTAEARLRASAGGIMTPFVPKERAEDDEWKKEEEDLESGSLVPGHLNIISNELVDDPDPDTEVGDEDDEDGE